MTHEHYSTYYSYQYNSTGLITATVRSNQIIEAPNSINQTEKFDIIEYYYDEAEGVAYMPERDAEGEVVIIDGKCIKDEAKLEKRIVLNRTSIKGVENKRKR